MPEPVAAPDIAIEVKGLTKSFGARKVVDNLTLSVPRGRILGFLGPNGSGKTTTIRMLCGLLTPDSGEGRCLGFDIRTQQEEIKRHVGYMTQGFSLYRDLTIRENLEFVARIYGIDSPRAAAQAALERLGLVARAGQLAGELSGGWKQRLALGACVLPNPALLLLDEPTAGVDPKARRDFWDEIHHLATQGLTVLVSTHYMDEAERCHEIAYILDGKLLVSGAIDRIIADAGLSTWVVTGEGLDALAGELKAAPGVDMVARFGVALHVAGRDADAMARVVERYADPAHHWARDRATLEDVFIELMTRNHRSAA
ncbi:ABC transporter ATP-binding protein [Methylocystis echinoides]|uniref:ABC transporter ATP-binding protein n=1 Tax=Methylocystis echinoides TaxID=29468 RepID=A0A9W6LRI1_9HYPH|nr:ABC transporter ATP-binding protein [Methylocystis echinoides]GLI92543.1 ABC transporter ATP-binding protein [Methylocystis echinoides]